MRSEWLDTAPVNIPQLKLCLSREDFFETMVEIGVDPDHEFFVAKGANAMVSKYEEDGEHPIMIVTLKGWESMPGVQIASLLAHEAVHVVQAWCDAANESTPGAEFFACSVQRVFQNLAEEFVRQTGVE